MSTTVPTRRLARPLRTTTAKDAENATRPVRLAARAKPLSAVATASALPPLSRVTAPTVASRAKAAVAETAAAGKRKRDVLIEVAANAKGKGLKSKSEGLVAKSKTTIARQPFGNKTKEAEHAQDEHAMAVDPASPKKLPIRRLSTRISELKEATRARGVVRTQPPIEVEETEPVPKKRRTSSESPESDHVPELTEEQMQEAAELAELEDYANGEPEADPEGSDWDDLDAEDADDPLMVSEYVVDIFNYLKVVEQTTLANPDYMSSQKDLAWKMRGILTDWLVQVHLRFRLLPETLFLTVNMIDRFLSARVVSLAKLQLVGVTCMFIAAKYDEIMAPSITHFLQCADASYTEKEILQAEKYVLKTLDWNLSYPNPVHYLRRISKADEYDVKVRTLGKYLLEISCLEWRLIAAPPSLIAAASIWLARLALGREVWTPNLAHYSSYPESALIPTATLMLNYIIKPVKHESFYKKYAGKRYFKSSLYMREWALDRWTENSQVPLEQELPAIKAEIRHGREREEARLIKEQQDLEAIERAEREFFEEP